MHWTLGRAVLALAIANIFIGCYLSHVKHSHIAAQAVVLGGLFIIYMLKNDIEYMLIKHTPAEEERLMAAVTKPGTLLRGFDDWAIMPAWSEHVTTTKPFGSTTLVCMHLNFVAAGQQSLHLKLCRMQYETLSCCFCALVEPIKRLASESCRLTRLLIACHGLYVVIGIVVSIACIHHSVMQATTEGGPLRQAVSLLSCSLNCDCCAGAEKYCVQMADMTKGKKPSAANGHTNGDAKGTNGTVTMV